MGENIYFVREEHGSFVYTGSSQDCHATNEMIDEFGQNGFILVKKLFSKEEIGKICLAVEQCQEFWDASFGLSDKTELRYFQTHWKEPGDDIFGMVERNVKVVNVCEQLLRRGEIYMYSDKIIMKQPETGGGLLWHQDYGYWYRYGCLFPDFVSCFLALTKSDQENGGLEVLKGSHLCGRLDHTAAAGQQEADPERVALIEKVLEHVYCNLEPGDAIFFHGNMLHRSGPNTSQYKRWNMVISYNAKENSPDLQHYNATYTEPLNKVPADSVEKIQSLKIQPRIFSNPKTNKLINSEA